MSIESINGNSKVKAEGPRSSAKLVTGYGVFAGCIKNGQETIYMLSEWTKVGHPEFQSSIIAATTKIFS